jgi:hypothetical protein
MEESPGPQPHDIPLLSSSNVLPSPRPSPVPEAPPSAPASNRLGVLVSAAIRSNLGSLMAAQLAHGQERPLPSGGPPRQPSSPPAYPLLARSPPPSRPRTTVVSTSSPLPATCSRSTASQHRDWPRCAPAPSSSLCRTRRPKMRRRDELVADHQTMAPSSSCPSPAPPAHRPQPLARSQIPTPVALLPDSGALRLSSQAGYAANRRQLPHGHLGEGEKEPIGKIREHGT